MSQARNAHAFVIVSYDPSSTKGKRTASTDSTSTGAEGVSKEGMRDLLLIGCRKKVVVFGGGKGGLKDAWVSATSSTSQYAPWTGHSYLRQELALPHSPRHIVLPASSRSSFPEAAHLLYSPTSSVLLHLHPTSTPHLSTTDLPVAPPPPSQLVASSAGGSSTAVGGKDEASGGGGGGGSGLSMGMGVSALSGLGGYVGLGGKAAVPVGTATVGGEVLLAREGECRLSAHCCIALSPGRPRRLHLFGRELHQAAVSPMARTTRRTW